MVKPERLAVIAAVFLAAAPSLCGQTPGGSLSYEFFRDRVQPIFLKKRPGHARCIACHQDREPRLQELSAGATSWNEEQSRKNFASWQRTVAAGDIEASRLLLHPLAKSAGGDAFHGGGKHWKSKDDPEWQTLAAWVRTGSSQMTGSSLDFETYRARVEPIFLKKRGPQEGAGLACVTCHSKLATRLRLQPLPDGAAAWTVEQSRANFVAASRVVAPGDPAQSPLLLLPLAAEAGWTAAHTGGKFWTSRENPEWQAVEAWVRTGKAGSAAAGPALDYEFFRDRVQPIFLKKRPGHARCVACHQDREPRLQELHAGATAWNEEQSRKNFASWQRTVAPGDIEASRLLLHPLAKSAGGDAFHGGGKHWKSKNDPEWQTLAAWVRGEKLTTGGSPR